MFSDQANSEGGIKALRSGQINGAYCNIIRSIDWKTSQWCF